MKKVLFTAAALSFVSASAFAAPVSDWRDIEKASGHIKEAHAEVARVCPANDDKMGGHCGKADAFLRKAEDELKLAVQKRKSEK